MTAIRIGGTINDALDPGCDDCLGASRGASVGGAGLESDIEGSPLGKGRRNLFQSFNLGMGESRSLVIAFGK